MSVKSDAQVGKIAKALDEFKIETASWAFADTGTRFGKFLQPAAAKTTAEKLADAGQVNALTGCCPTVALHVLWDTPPGSNLADVKKLAEKYGVRPGAINPNVFQDQIYKHGGLANEQETVRKAALDHILYSVKVARELASRDVSCWFGDGSNYPGTANIRARKHWMAEGLKAVHDALGVDQRLLIEYKPFEPAFYHTDIGDWGMALLFAKAAGPKARVLVDTGHHYQGQNIEQIVAWLLDENMLGGFHFNNRRYADDDLTLGSIDPYQDFRVFAEICSYAWEKSRAPDLIYMIDQSHNLKDKIEETIQTVIAAQSFFAKAALVDHAALAKYQQKCALIDAEECLKSAFATDVRPVLKAWRKSKGLPADPLAAFRASGYMKRITKDRAEKNAASGGSYA